MATFHISEIEAMLKRRGEPHLGQSGQGFLLEIRFDKPGEVERCIELGAVDREFVDKVLTVDCPYGSVTIEFDAAGQLRSLDIS